MRYKICIKTLQGIILTFSVDSYEVKDGLICFTDKVTNIQKQFPVLNCEISGVEE